MQKKQDLRNADAKKQQPQQTPPTDLMADWKWAFSRRGTGAFKDYVGRYVAVLNRTVVDVGEDPAKLRNGVSLKQGVDPERIAVLYVDPIAAQPEMLR